ncbi:MAG: GGDEF domain-containing protein [Lachnospiraceae bacterium]|nr:GGDEF domain-containing protein [Lachnospiraceae bacterium]
MTNLPTEESEVKGIHIRTVNVFMIVASVFFSIFTGIGLFHVYDAYDEVENTTREYIESRNVIEGMKIGSDYLTDEVRAYVVTEDTSHLRNYFEEAFVTKRREQAIEQLSAKISRDEHVYRELQVALAESNALMEKEYHAMRLILYSNHADMSDMPQQLQEYELFQYEKDFTDEQRRRIAYNLVFGTEYAVFKEQIEGSTSEAVTLVEELMADEQEESERYLLHSLRVAMVCIVGLVVTILMTSLFLWRFIVVPLHQFIDSVRRDQKLPESRTYEFEYLALTYNHLFELHSADMSKLEHKAEHDALTGLLNRAAYDGLTEYLSRYPNPLALLIMDVDDFKNVNDSYGHEIGDGALKLVAKLLSTTFRNGDYPIRYGGDEFIVIMTDVTEDMQHAIRLKIQKINVALQSQVMEGLPRLSVSVGIAFSERGYDPELFLRADEALYHTKENGRCGFTFHDPKKMSYHSCKVD